MIQESTPLWKLIPLDKYAKPAEPAGEIARSRMQALWARVRRRKPAPTSSQSIQVELRSVPQEVLDSIAPPPTWEEACRALTPVLQAWLETDPNNGQSVRVIVGPPGSGTRQILEKWAGGRVCLQGLCQRFDCRGRGHLRAALPSRRLGQD